MHYSALIVASVRVPGFAVVFQHQGSGHAGAADAWELADVHPHREVALVDAVAGGAGGAEQLHVGWVLLARAAGGGRVQDQATYR